MAKNTTKKNEEKLRLYLSKQNDTKQRIKKNKDNSGGTPPGKELRHGAGK